MRNLSALLICFGLLFSVNASCVLVDRIVAIVNNEPILLSEVKEFASTFPLRKEIDPFINLTEGFTSTSLTDKVVIDYLIQEKLIAQNPFFKVVDSEVDARVNEIIKNNSLSRDHLESFLAAKGFNYQQYWNLLRISIQKQNLLDREIRSRVNISDEDVRNNFYNLNTNVSIPLEYSIQLIVVDAKKYKSVKAAQQIAEAALNSLKEGEAFKDVAKRNSDDPSADAGGDLGFVSAEYLNTSILNSLKKLSIGATTPVVNVDDKFYIVRLLDVRSQHSEKFQAQKDHIREDLAKKEYVKQIALWTVRSKSDAFVKINQ